MKKFVLGLALLTATAGWGQAIYNQNTPPFISCNAATTTGACSYATLPLFNGYTLPSSFSWETIFTGGPSGVAVNLEGSIDGRDTMDVNTTASSTTVTSATMKFTQADVGKSIYVGGAGTAGATLVTTIASVTNATTAVMSASATASTVNTVGFVGTFVQMDQSTVTAGEQRAVVNKTEKYIRCNVVTLTAGTSPTATCLFVAKGA